MVHIARNFVIILKNLLQMNIKPLQKSHQKTAEATGDLIGNEIANKIAAVSKNSQQNDSEMNMIIKYLKKDKYLQKKDRKILMI